MFEWGFTSLKARNILDCHFHEQTHVWKILKSTRIGSTPLKHQTIMASIHAYCVLNGPSEILEAWFYSCIVGLPSEKHSFMSTQSHIMDFLVVLLSFTFLGTPKLRLITSLTMMMSRSMNHIAGLMLNSLSPHQLDLDVADH